LILKFFQLQPGRNHGPDQNRLANELRLAGLSTIGKAILVGRIQISPKGQSASPAAGRERTFLLWLDRPQYRIDIFFNFVHTVFHEEQIVPTVYVQLRSGGRYPGGSRLAFRRKKIGP
jgi:hypothetical protein